MAICRFIAAAVAQLAFITSANAEVKPTTVETESSRVYILVQGTGMSRDHGIEARLKSGSLELGRGSKAGRLVFDLSSFETDTPRARRVVGLEGESPEWMRKAVNEQMRSERVLDIKKYPEASFEIDSALPIGVDRASGRSLFRLSGTFVLRKITRPLEIVVSAEETRGWIHVNGSFAFQQSSFGIEPFKRGFGAVGVQDQLTVIGSLWVSPSTRSQAAIANGKAPMRR